MVIATQPESTLQIEHKQVGVDDMSTILAAAENLRSELGMGQVFDAELVE